MGELIRIGAEEGGNGLGATVNTHGAQVESLSIGRDHFVFPADLIATADGFKLRGGIPLCSPYFGPDLIGDGPQHGYAREVDWEILDQGERYVRLGHIVEDGYRYKGLEHQLGIQIIDLAHIRILAVNLRLTNRGQEGIVVSPGFHPYFSGPAEFGECSPVAKQDSTVNLTENYSMRIIRLLSGATIRMVAINMPNSTVWSDVPEEFHCVEPSVLPISTTPRAEESLTPGESKQYSVSLIINPIKVSV
jgi:Aldose 1-epimerase